MCNEPTNPDTLIPNVTCKGVKLLHTDISYLLTIVSLLGEGIYKYKKQKEVKAKGRRYWCSHYCIHIIL